MKVILQSRSGKCVVFSTQWDRLVECIRLPVRENDLAVLHKLHEEPPPPSFTERRFCLQSGLVRPPGHDKPLHLYLEECSK